MNKGIPSYPIDTDPKQVLKEQLRLFAFDDTQILSPTVSTQIRDGLSKRERLATLLQGELNFHGENSSYASHDLHAFAAKFPPQLPRAFIRGLTSSDDIVLDPMMGSGTTIVEALLEGRNAIGLDIDPLALRLGRVKTLPLDIDQLRDAGQAVLSRANKLLSNGKTVERGLAQFDKRTKAFIDYWFLPVTQRELMALTLAIQDTQDASERRFLELTFSSVIVTKSGGVSLARDLAHSRPHLDKAKVPKNALDQFSLRLKKNLVSLARLNNANGAATIPLAGDARAMPIADQVIDLIVTSPPYANAIDYMRAHKFSLVWLGESVVYLSKLRAEYIGSERVGGLQHEALPARPDAIIQQLAERDHAKAAILRKYFSEMRAVLVEMYRVLCNDSAAVIVVGTSIMRDIDVETQYCLADIAADLGFDVVGIARRILDRNKRMMPARFGKKTVSMIEQRMHDEYVIGLLRPNRP